MLSDLFDLREFKKCAYFAQNRLKEQQRQNQSYVLTKVYRRT